MARFLFSPVPRAALRGARVRGGPERAHAAAQKKTASTANERWLT